MLKHFTGCIPFSDVRQKPMYILRPVYVVFVKESNKWGKKQ